MIRKPAHTALLIVIILWCGLLGSGAILLAFIGMMFAGEPGGGGMGVPEYWAVSLPLLQTVALSAVLFTLWRNAYHVWALFVLLASMVFVIYRYHGWLL